MTTFHCPVCQGPLASWVVRAEFTCHHCSWALRSNVGGAFAWALGVGGAAEVAVLVLLWVFVPGRLDPLIVWLSLSGVVGYAVGYVVFSRTLVLSPMRPQRVPARAMSNPPQVQEADQ